MLASADIRVELVALEGERRRAGVSMLTPRALRLQTSSVCDHRCPPVRLGGGGYGRCQRIPVGRHVRQMYDLHRAGPGQFEKFDMVALIVNNFRHYPSIDLSPHLLLNGGIASNGQSGFVPW